MGNNTKLKITLNDDNAKKCSARLRCNATLNNNAHSRSKVSAGYNEFNLPLIVDT